MKKTFEQPEMMVVRIHTNDVILTSTSIPVNDPNTKSVFTEEYLVGAPERFRDEF